MYIALVNRLIKQMVSDWRKIIGTSELYGKLKHGIIVHGVSPYYCHIIQQTLRNPIDRHVLHTQREMSTLHFFIGLSFNIFGMDHMHSNYS